MPELPEVEVLVRHLAPRLKGATIRNVVVRDPRSIRPHRPEEFQAVLQNARIRGLHRRAKYLVFSIARKTQHLELVGHLGMTGRMYLARQQTPVPRHGVVILDLGTRLLVFEDSRRFGRLTLGNPALARLGPEPLDPRFATRRFGEVLGRSRQAVKVKLLDQSTLAGIGNIYASEILFRARIDPRRQARSLNPSEIRRLQKAIVHVLFEAIRFGSTVPLNFTGEKRGESVFYFGLSSASKTRYQERLRAYDREGERCLRCHGRIRRIVQSNRSTYFCPKCQK